MRRLLLLRHAKAAVGDSRMADKDRPLNEVGREACQAMGVHIKKNHINPDLILCSTSVRTRETYQLMQASAGLKAEIRYFDELYHATAGELLRTVQKAPAEAGSLMVIAHNPGIHNFALKLVREGKAEAIELLEEKYPTCGLAVIEFDIKDWSKLERGTGFLASFTVPQSLED